jgi:GT2 family glycosyltransferase
MTIECVELLLRESAVAKVVIVDNASTDDSVEHFERLADDRVEVVALTTPHGFAAANNRGIERGTSPLVLLLNSDIFVTPGAVEGLVNALRDDPGASCAGGRLVDPETGETQAAYRPRPFPRLRNFAVILTGIEELLPANPITRRYHGATVTATSTSAVDAQPAAAALMVPRHHLEAIDGFDERFWFWFEDADIVQRLHRRGRVLYVPGAVFRHLGGGTFSRWSKAQRIRSVHHGILHYGAAQFRRPGRIGLGLLAVGVSIPRIVLFRRSRPAEVTAWRSIRAAGMALIAGREVPQIAPEPPEPGDG